MRSEELIRSLPDAVVAIDGRGAIDFFNPAAEELFGYTSEFAVGRAFPGLIAETSVDEYEAYMESHIAGEDVPILGETVEAVGRRADGSTFPMELVLTHLESEDAGMLVAIVRDIRERKSEEAQLRRLAEHDDSTGLMNRRAFELELTRHIDHAARYGGGGAVIEIDVDNFKYVNETLGPEGGDQLIKEVAGVIRRRLRKTDVLARLGGDELGILVHGAGRAKASAIASDLLVLIREHNFAISRQPVRVTASAGVAPLDERPITGAVLLAEAEVAMYEAKDHGKDRVVEYTAEEREEIDSRRMWTERVRQATERGLFVLVCQPIQNLETDEITQYELLLRMRGENGQLVPPGAFLATAERFGLIGAVDRWVTQQAVRLIAAQNERGKQLILEVNLSGKTMTDANFPIQLEKDLRREGIDPSQLVFEVTETAAVANIEQAKEMVAKLTAIGCRFALDDFGAGYAGLLLPEAPPDQLPEDRRRVRQGAARHAHRPVDRQGPRRRLQGHRDQDDRRVRRGRANPRDAPRPRSRLRAGLPRGQAGAGRDPGGAAQAAEGTRSGVIPTPLRRPGRPLERDQERLVGLARSLLQADLAGAVAADVRVVVGARQLRCLVGRRRPRQLRVEHSPVAGEAAAGGADRRLRLVGDRCAERLELAGQARVAGRARRVDGDRSEPGGHLQRRQQAVVGPRDRVEDLELRVALGVLLGQRRDDLGAETRARRSWRR